MPKMANLVVVFVWFLLLHSASCAVNNDKPNEVFRTGKSKSFAYLMLLIH